MAYEPRDLLHEAKVYVGGRKLTYEEEKEATDRASQTTTDNDDKNE